MRVVVIGGGYGGLRFIESFAPFSKAYITLIDKNPYHYLQTEAYEFLSGRKNICDVTFNLESFCSYFDNVEFVEDEAISIEEKRVICKECVVEFDILIIATGSVDFFPTPDIAKFSPKLKELLEAFEFKQNFLKALAREISSYERAKIVVGGGGLSGVELAADFASVAKSCNKEIGQNSFIEVSLVEACENLLPSSSHFLQKETAKRLKELGVELFFNSPIQKVEDDKIYLANKVLEYDLFIFAGGIRGGEFVKNLPFRKNSLYQLEVDKYLRVDKNIFAIGDCAAIKDEKGNMLPPTAQIAEQSASYLARYLLGKTKRGFRGKIYGTFVALGKNYAVGELFGLRFKGRIAAIIKDMIERFYAFGIKIKVNSGYKKRL